MYGFGYCEFEPGQAMFIDIGICNSMVGSAIWELIAQVRQ